METYVRPILTPDVVVHQFAPDHLKGVELTPEAIVVIINRHPSKPYRDKFDGINYTIPGGEVGEITYAAAMHFRERSVVPGSRNPATHKEDHFIAILNIDPVERCQPFTDEQAALFDALPEAIDRSDDPTAFHVVSNAEVHASVAGLSENTRPVIEVTDKTVLVPPVGGEAARASKTGELRRPRG